MSKLELQIQWQDKRCIVTLTGDGGIAEAELLEETLKKVPVEEAESAIFDLSKLNLICSLAITVLINFRSRLHRGATMALVIQPGHVRDALVRSRVIELFDHYDTLEEALSQ